MQRLVTQNAYFPPRDPDAPAAPPTKTQPSDGLGPEILTAVAAEPVPQRLIDLAEELGLALEKAQQRNEI